MVLPQSRLSSGVQGRGAPEGEIFEAGEAAALGDPGIHAARIGIERRAGGGGEAGQIGFGAFAHAQGAHHAIQRQGAGAEQLGQLAGGGAAGDVHLEHALAGMQIAQRRIGIQLVGGMDAGDAIRVQRDADRGGQARYAGCAAAAGQGLPNEHAAADDGDHQEDGEEGQEAAGTAQHSVHAQR